jgi:hypothetical protein
MDHFYGLEMLVECEELMLHCESEYLSGIITSIQAHVKLLFNTFIDAEIEWLNSLRPSPKRCGVLLPFAKFPAFIDRIENIVRVNNSQAADTTYHKLAFAMFKWLDGKFK